MEPEGELEIGQVLGNKYRIVRPIGCGGMGSVYEAQHCELGRRFAIKVLRPELSANDQAVKRFRREAHTAGTLENENIAGVLDFGETPQGIPFIVMEYLEGEDLAQLLEQGGPLAATRAVSLVMQACRGLKAAHAKGIVHRDLKPANLFVVQRSDGTDQVKILDFGIAKLLGALPDDADVTKTGATIGTCYYMSPEQARGERDIDEHTDIYALGVILYELLSGQRPYDGETLNRVLYRIMTPTEEPPRLSELRPGLPEGLVEVVEWAMSKDVGQRPPTVDALTSELTRFVERRSSAPPPETGDTRALPDTKTAPEGPRIWVETTDGIASRAGRRPRPRTMLGVFGAVGLVVVGVVVWLAVGFRGTAGQAPSPGRSIASPASPAASELPSHEAPEVPVAPDVPVVPVDVRAVSADASGRPDAPAGKRANPSEPAPSFAPNPHKTKTYRHPLEPRRVASAQAMQDEASKPSAEPPPKASSAAPAPSASKEFLYAP